MPGQLVWTFLCMLASKSSSWSTVSFRHSLGNVIAQTQRCLLVEIIALLSCALLFFQLLMDSSVMRSSETHATVVETLYWEGLAGLLYEGRNSHWPVSWKVFIYSMRMSLKRVLAWGTAAMCRGTWPLDQRVPLVAVSCCSDQEDTPTRVLAACTSLWGNRRESLTQHWLQQKK